MEKIFLGLFLLTSHIYSMDATKLEEYELSRKVSASHRFLVGVKELAYTIGCYRPLQAMESSLDHLSEAYRYNNMLANVGFIARVIAPELREKSDIIAVRLSRKDLNGLHHELFHIRNHVIEIAENQNLQALSPLLLRVTNQSDGAMLVASKTVDAITETCKTSIILRTFTAVADVCGAGELAHDLKKEILSDMLRSFERVEALVSLINVDKFRKEDSYRMEEISKSLNVIRLIIKKANTL